ncbi:MAG: tol-pal system-associated acyl-CoA thioesterase [Pseudomonadota bacterium]
MSCDHFTWPVRVYYEDTDAGGIVYYANYLRFMERARTEYLRALGVEQDEWVGTHGLQFVVRRLGVNYLQPARFNDALVVSARVQRVRRASVEFDQNVVRERDATVLVTASVQVACVASDSGVPRPIPQTLIEAMQGDR